MIASFLTKVFGSKNERELKKLHPLVERINALEPDVQSMSDDRLRSQTQLFRERLEKGESIEDLLPEAFATVREASVRALKMRHFDVQLVGGIVLHQGKIIWQSVTPNGWDTFINFWDCPSVPLSTVWTIANVIPLTVRI
jgi:preprotein translocase subunit SecA